MNNKIVIAIVIVAVVLVGGYFLFRGTPQSTPSVTQPSSQQTAPQAPVSEQPSAVVIPQSPVDQTPAVEEKVVTYTDSDYSPSTITVKKGEAVTFKNQSSNSMWTASAVHPTHRIYSGTSLDEHCGDDANTAFDACKGILPSGLWSFTFDKVGTWEYHNHLSPGDTGTVVVE